MDLNDLKHAIKLSFETTSKLLRKAGMNSAASENNKALAETISIIDSCSLHPEPRTCIDDGLLWQEIYSLREKLKIAVAAIKSYDSDFNDSEFTHRLNSVDYDQLMEEIAGQSEPRTCETCGSAADLDECHDYAREGADCTAWVPTPRSPQSADVEMVRNAIRSAIGFVQELRYRGIVDDWSGESGLSKALAALDRIVGKEE